MSEQQAEQTSGEPGSLSAGPAVPNSSDASSRPVAGFRTGSSRPSWCPSRVPPAKVDAPKAEAPKADASKADAPKVETPKAEAPRAPGKVMIMSAGDRNWDGDSAGPEAESELHRGMFGKRRLSALAAVVALAAVAGALGGALATAGLSHFIGGEVASTDNRALEASVARIDADILALKASVEHTSKFDISPVQQDQRPPRQGREGAGRAGRQTRQAQRGRGQASRHAGGRFRSRGRGGSCGRRKSPARSRLRAAAQLRPRPRWRGCRRWKAGCCVTSPMAAR